MVGRGDRAAGDEIDLKIERRKLDIGTNSDVYPVLEFVLDALRGLGEIHRFVLCLLLLLRPFLETFSQKYILN